MRERSLRPPLKKNCHQEIIPTNLWRLETLRRKKMQRYLLFLFAMSAKRFSLPRHSSYSMKANIMEEKYHRAIVVESLMKLWQGCFCTWSRAMVYRPNVNNVARFITRCKHFRLTCASNALESRLSNFQKRRRKTQKRRRKNMFVLFVLRFLNIQGH